MKKTLSLMLAVCITLSLCACGGKTPSTSGSGAGSTTPPAGNTSGTPSTPSGSGAYDASGDPKIDLIFTANASSADWHGMAMTTFAEEVEKLSGGSVTCSVFPDSTLYSSENEWDAINQGQDGGGADMAYISFPTLSTQPGLEWCAMIQL